jgi:hypothetical protein
MELRDKIALWYPAAHKLKNPTIKEAEESAHKEFLKAFDGLETKTLDVYYSDIVRQGAKKAWSVDLSNADVNQQCGLTWTWTVITKKMVEGADIGPRPWLIAIDACNFSIPLMEKIVNAWARDRGHNFEVKIRKTARSVK